MTSRGEERRLRLLVVDDDDIVRALFERILSAERYEILTAGSASAAVQLAWTEKQPVDLLVTDVIMPEMKGPALCRELEQIWPELRVLYMSGYPRAQLESLGVAADARYLPKPFNPTTLIPAIEDALKGLP